MKNCYPIEVHSVANGWVVKVGCQVLVFKDLDEFTLELKSYLRDPVAMEQKWFPKAATENQIAPSTCHEIAQEAVNPSRRLDAILRR